MKKLIFLLVLVFFASAVISQVEKKDFKVVSYNVENYFDYQHDSLKLDQEYLPGGIRGWNSQKYHAKQNHISQVIAAIGGWNPPTIVGLYEVENEKCMYELTNYSPLKNLKYKYIHYESPDARGIDVAMMYQSDMFKPIKSFPISINFPDDVYKTRDLLYVSGKIPTGDTLHLFFCHFPSRLGGELESEDRRSFVASTLRSKVDSIFETNLEAKIIIMGDFNDYPSNISIEKTLGASQLSDSIRSNKLYNLAFALQEKGIGSHKFEAEWGMLDQIIVSGSLLNPEKKIFTTQSDMHVFNADFLLLDDEKYLGKKAFRTYNGMKYQGGYSDHLPVYVDLWY